MTRLIDADALIRKFKTASPMAIDGRARQMVEEMPTIEERKKGRWKRRVVDSGFNADWVCSECKYRLKTDFVSYNFCPNCGADMRGEQNE